MDLSEPPCAVQCSAVRHRESHRFSGRGGRAPCVLITTCPAAEAVPADPKWQTQAPATYIITQIQCSEPCTEGNSVDGCWRREYGLFGNSKSPEDGLMHGTQAWLAFADAADAVYVRRCYIVRETRRIEQLYRDAVHVTV